MNETDHCILNNEMRREFYVRLAYLFYAVAKADRNFELNEKKKIVEFSNLYFSEEVLSQQSTEVIYATMRDLIQMNLSSDEAYDKFVRYFRLNKEQFHPEIIHKILVVCHEIADSFSGKNKSELILLARLQQLFMPKES